MTKCDKQRKSYELRNNYYKVCQNNTAKCDIYYREAEFITKCER